MRKPEYRSLGVQPFSPIDNKKQICEVLVTSQFNKDKSTIKVDEGQKMTEVTRTSTPKNKVYCYRNRECLKCNGVLNYK